jgi:hypothetical protein
MLDGRALNVLWLYHVVLGLEDSNKDSFCCSCIQPMWIPG